MNPLAEKNPRHERYRLIGIVMWVSFVAASVASSFFFATFDPLDIIEKTTFPLDWDRMDCYSVGFLMFWLLTAGTGAMVAWLVSLQPIPVTTATHRTTENGNKLL